MKKFVIFHYGFEMPTPEIMEAWSKWFASLGDKMIDPAAHLDLEEKSRPLEPENCHWKRTP